MRLRLVLVATAAASCLASPAGALAQGPASEGADVYHDAFCFEQDGATHCVAPHYVRNTASGGSGTVSSTATSHDSSTSDAAGCDERRTTHEKTHELLSSDGETQQRHFVGRGTIAVSCPDLGLTAFCYARAVYVETNGTVRADIFDSDCRETLSD